MKCNFLAHSLALQIISPELSGDSSCILTPSQSRFPRSWPTFVSQSQCQHNYRRIKCHDQDQRSFIRITAFVTRIVCDVWWSSILFMSFLCPSKMYENFYICAWPIMRAYFCRTINQDLSHELHLWLRRWMSSYSDTTKMCPNGK